MRMLVFVAMLLPACAVAAGAAEKNARPPCDISASAKGAFSSAEPSDTITATVKGSPCWSGRFRIVIHDSGGRVLYEYDQLFKQHSAIHWEDDEGLLDAARRLVNETVKDAFSRTSKISRGFFRRPSSTRKTTSSCSFRNFNTTHSGNEVFRFLFI